MEGRWTVFVCTGCEQPTGRHKDCDAKREATPVVPCDEAAVERAAQMLCHGGMDFADGWVQGDTDRDYPRLIAEAVLQAAAGKP